MNRNEKGCVRSAIAVATKRPPLKLVRLDRTIIPLIMAAWYRVITTTILDGLCFTVLDGDHRSSRSLNLAAVFAPVSSPIMFLINSVSWCVRVCRVRVRACVYSDLRVGTLIEPHLLRRLELFV